MTCLSHIYVSCDVLALINECVRSWVCMNTREFYCYFLIDTHSCIYNFFYYYFFSPVLFQLNFFFSHFDSFPVAWIFWKNSWYNSIYIFVSLIVRLLFFYFISLCFFFETTDCKVRITKKRHTHQHRTMPATTINEKEPYDQMKRTEKKTIRNQFPSKQWKTHFFVPAKDDE